MIRHRRFCPYPRQRAAAARAAAGERGKGIEKPYNREFTNKLIRCAQDAGIDYAVDTYYSYSSDASVAIRTGYDVRHGLIGPGVYASHGYERTHLDGIYNTFALLRAWRCAR